MEPLPPSHRDVYILPPNCITARSSHLDYKMPIAADDNKPHITQLEFVESHHHGDEPSKPIDNFDLGTYGELSSHANWTFRQTVTRFRKAMLICLGAGICAMGDGYQFKMPGNIVALRGFIDQMGSPNASGVYVLNPQHVALWGGEWQFTYANHVRR